MIVMGNNPIRIDNIENVLDSMYKTTLGQQPTIQNKILLVQQLHNSISHSNPNSPDLGLTKTLYDMYSEVLTNQAKQAQMGSALNHNNNGYNSALNTSLINNNQQAGYGSALSALNNMQQADTNDTTGGRLGMSSTPAQEPVQQQATQQANTNSTLTTNVPMAKGFEIAPFMFECFKLDYVTLGMTKAYEIKFKEGINMQEGLSIPTIVNLEEEGYGFSTSDVMINSLLMCAEENKVNGATFVGVNETSFVVQKNRARDFVLSLLSTNNVVSLENLVTVANAQLEPVKSKLSAFISSVYVPYIIIAFRKNQIPLGLDNLVNDYQPLMEFAAQQFNNGCVGITMDLQNAIKAGDQTIINIIRHTTDIIADIKENVLGDTTECKGNLKTLNIYEKVKYLYLDPSNMKNLHKVNKFYDILEDVLVPLPTKIDQHGSNRIFDEVIKTDNTINRIILSDGINYYNIYRFANEWYLYKA